MRQDGFSGTGSRSSSVAAANCSGWHVATRCCSIETQKRRLEAEERRRSDTEHSQPRNQRLEVDGHSPSIVHPLHFRLPMVREVRYAVDFPQCTPKEFFDIIFSDDVSTKIFHKLNSSAEGATVTPWENNTRTVEFFRMLQLPRPISAVLGCSKIRIREIQVLERKGETEFTVSSSPDLQIGMGPTLASTTQLAVNSKNEGSEVSVLVTCSASGPWGMVGLIEGYMADEATTGIGAFLTFCETRIAEKKLEDSISSDSATESEDIPFYDVKYESLSQGSFADHTILESRDSNGMLTSEALILARVKQLEEDHRISIQKTEVIKRKIEFLEISLTKSQRNTQLALMGCSVLSFALVASLIALKIRDH